MENKVEIDVFVVRDFILENLVAVVEIIPSSDKTRLAGVAERLGLEPGDAKRAKLIFDPEAEQPEVPEIPDPKDKKAGPCQACGAKGAVMRRTPGTTQKPGLWFMHCSKCQHRTKPTMRMEDAVADWNTEPEVPLASEDEG